MNNHCPAYSFPITVALIVTVIYSVVTVDAFLINILAALFLESNYDYQLFVDADVSFEPEVIGSMIMAQKDFICAPYRKKTHDNSVSYSVAFPDYKNINIDKSGIAEIIGGPAGLTLIHRSVYEKLIKNYPQLQIKYASGISDEAKKYLYNFSLVFLY